jgi:putative ABC transport system permease protein
MDRTPRIPGLRRVFQLSGARRVQTEVDEELRFHLDMRAAELVRRGLRPSDAREQALREFGDVREARGELAAIDRRRTARRDRAEWWSDLWHDLRFAARVLRRQPGFTVVVLLTLTVGIGANTAIFTVVDAALLRPLPYREPERLVHLWETHRGDVSDRSEASYPDFLDWRAQSRAFAAIEGYDETNLTVTADGAEPLMLRGARVTPGFFPMLGVTPARGRAFIPEESVAGGAPVVLLTHGFWRRRFGGDPQVIGRSLTLDRRPFTVIGVLPRDFHFAPVDDAELWLPIDPAAQRTSERFNHWLNVVARLGPGVTLDGASSDLSTVMRRLGAQYPETNAGRGIGIVPLRDEIVGAVRPTLLVLFGAVGCVLLVACVNVAGLVLARSAARGREIAVRSALGAERGRIVRQLLVESALLAVAGGVLGAVTAQLGVRLIVAALPAEITNGMPYLQYLRVDGVVLAYAAGLAVAAGLLSGLAPALYVSRPSTTELLRRGGRGGSGGAKPRLRGALVAAEIALTMVLLVAAGLMTRSLGQLLRVDAGFDAEHVLTARVALSGAAYDSAERQQRFFEALVGRVAALPGVRAAGAVLHVPLVGGGTNTFRAEGRPEPDPANRPEATMRGVAGDYFRAMAIRVVAGRSFTDRDRAGASPVLVVSAGLARRLFREGASAIGQQLRFYAFPESAWTIVGVVGDVKTGRLDAEAPPTIYYPHLQGAQNRMSIVARTVGDPAALAGAVRREVRALDPTVPVYQVRTMEEQVARSPAVFARRLPLRLVGAFAATALALAVVGIYGLVTYTVAQRTQELGIRIALGAQRRNILTLVVREGALLAAVGVSIGLVVALWATRMLGSLLYGVGAADPLTYVAVAVLLGGVALVASYVPARRAARIDPMVALRAGE